MTKNPKYENEKDVKRQVKKLLTKHKWFWWMPAANGFGRAGIADINAFRGGVFLAIETKFGKNKPTPNQIGFLNSILSESGFAFIVSESRVEWLQAWLEAFDRSTERATRNEAPTVEDGALMLDAIREMTHELAGDENPVKPSEQH